MINHTTKKIKRLGTLTRNSNRVEFSTIDGWFIDAVSYNRDKITLTESIILPDLLYYLEFLRGNYYKGIVRTKINVEQS